MKRISILIALAILLGSGCSGPPVTSREKATLGGAAMGAGLGAIIGNQVGNTAAGVAIGTAVGSLSGALVGNEIYRKDKIISEREKIIQEREKQIKENRRLLEELKAKGLDAKLSQRGVTVNLPDVLFEFDSDRLTSFAKSTVADIADIISSSVKGRKIAIEGHTDSIGTKEYNLDLSRRRANSVARELNKHGISRKRMIVKGFGESRPIASNKTPAGRQRNRRVEVIVLN